MKKLSLAIFFICLGTITSNSSAQESSCYCETIKENTQSVKKKCVKINTDGTFQFKWQSKFAHHRGERFVIMSEGIESGKWISKESTIFLSTNRQPKDYYTIRRLKSDIKTDSVQVILNPNQKANPRIGGNSNFQSLMLGKLIKYSNDTIVKEYQFTNSRTLKIPLDTISLFSVINFPSPPVLKFKLAKDETTLIIETKQYNFTTERIIKDQEVTIEKNKLRWSELSEQKEGLYKAKKWNQVSLKEYDEYLK